MLATVNRQDCYERPPDWRWQRVGELRRLGITVRKGSDHTDICTISRFRAQLERAHTQARMLALMNNYPDIFTAWSVYQDQESRELKGEVEARILAREPYEDIARKVAITSEAVVAYEMYFFNVTDRLDSPGYLTHKVFGKSVQTGLAEREFDLLWKMYGFWCGPLVLDALIYKFNGPPRPETAENVTALWNSDVSATLKMTAAIMMRQRPTEWERQVEIGNMYLRMLELERGAASGGAGGSEAIYANINAMLERLPWQKYDLGVRHPDEAKTQVERIEMRGFGLRSAELAMVSIGMPPPELAHLIEGAVYPVIKDVQNEQDNP